MHHFSGFMVKGPSALLIVLVILFNYWFVGLSNLINILYTFSMLIPLLSQVDTLVSQHLTLFANVLITSPRWFVTLNRMQNNPYYMTT